MTSSQREDALAQASVPTLLMCLAQITGDDRWLQEPFLPRRDISIFAETGGGLTEAAQSMVRSAIAEVLDELAQGRRQLPALPDDERMWKMMNVCVGDKVPVEYVRKIGRAHV